MRQFLLNSVCFAPEGEAPAAVVPAAPPAAPESGSPLGEAPAGEETTPAPAGESTEGAPVKDKVEGAEGEAAVPETYDITLPEGFQVDDTAMGEFTEFAKTNKLSNEAAQAAFNLFHKQVTAQAESFAAEQATAWKTTLDGWKTELGQDPSFAGEKAKAAQQAIGKALDVYGTPETRQAFDLTGAGWNPAIVKFVHSMAKALDEGGIIPGGGPSKGPRTLGETFYPAKETS